MWGEILSVVGPMVLDYLSSEESSDAASKASGATVEGAKLGIEEQRRQFDAIQKLLSPYVSAGSNAIGSQQNLLGLNGQVAQQTALNAIKGGSEFKDLTQQGENAILQNASATGGLRGGNVQGALAQFRPQVLSSLIQQQFGNLGSLSSLGQASAVGQASLGAQTGNNVSNLLGDIGSANAGNALAQGKARADLWNNMGNTLGTAAGSQF